MELRRTEAVVGVLTVTVVDTANVPDEGMTVAGEKLHAAPGGRPEQLNETVELKPFDGVMSIVAVPLCPGINVSDPGEIAMEKSAGSELMM